MAGDEQGTLETARLALTVLGPGDEARLQAVFEAAADWFTALTGAPGPVADAAAQEIAGGAAAPGRRIAVLTPIGGGEDVGALGWWEGNPEPGWALLGIVMMVPSHRGQGLAREALEGLELWLAARGVHSLRTAFPRRRFALHGIVKALGFREMSIAEHQKLGLNGAGTSLWEKRIGPL